MQPVEASVPKSGMARRLVLPLGLLLLVFAAYAPVLKGDFIWDDEAYVVDNLTLRSAAGLRAIWIPGNTTQYYPLTFTGFWIQYHLWGLNPLGYHAVNVLLHGLTAILLAYVLQRLGLQWAWWAGALFALHPVNVMSVAWITELKNVLSGFLLLGALLSYVVYLEKKEPGRGASPRPFYGLAFVLFAGAILAKSGAFILLVALPLIAWWKKGRVSRADWLGYLPWLGFSVAISLVTIHLEHTPVWEAPDPPSFSYPQRLILSGQSFWFYLSKALLPLDLVFFYPQWTVDAARVSNYAWPASVLILLAVLWARRNRWGRGPLVAVSLYYFSTAGLILLHVLYMTRFTYVSDHWQYFGLMALIPMLAGGLWHALPRRPGGRAWTLAVLFGVCVVLIWRQSVPYRNLESLWRHTLRGNPRSEIALINLGTLLAQQGRLQEAMEQYQRARQIHPDHLDVLDGIGGLLAMQGRGAEALEHYRQVLQRYEGSASIHGNYAALLFQYGDVRAALPHMERALKMAPRHRRVRANLLGALTNRARREVRNGRTAEARELCREVRALDRELGDSLVEKVRLVDRAPGRE
ncbi:MAG: tetratricopeptide repeat protein [Kiritimatiellae bacterium]|nr:tetratricopeptide repeat protein [Kiritimatiellia bacterium]